MGVQQGQPKKMGLVELSQQVVTHATSVQTALMRQLYHSQPRGEATMRSPSFEAAPEKEMKPVNPLDEIATNLQVAIEICEALDELIQRELAEKL